MSPRPGPCARRRADPPRAPPGVAPPPVACRRPAWGRRSFHILLQSSHRMMVMHARRAGSPPQGRRNLRVLEPLLRAQQGLEYAEIAAALGTTPGAARVHYHHAVRRLKEYVK